MTGGHYVHKKCDICGKMVRQLYKQGVGLVCYRCHMYTDRDMRNKLLRLREEMEGGRK
jgi:hypothetical protein